MNNYENDINDEITDSMSEPINYTANKAKNRIKGEMKRQVRRSINKLSKATAKALAKGVKALAKSLLVIIKALLPYLLVVLAILIFIMFAYFVIFEFTGTEKEYTKEYENKVEKRADGTYYIAPSDMNEQNKIIRDYYRYFAGQSYWKLINSDNETLYAPDERVEVKDEYNREHMFLLPGNLLFALDEQMYNWGFKYAEQFISPVYYNKSSLELLPLVNEERVVIAESEEINIDTGELTGNKIASVRDYGLGSVIKYNEKENYKKVRKIKGKYIAEDIWNSDTKTVETVSYNTPVDFDIEISEKEDIWLIDKVTLFTGEVEYEYEYRDEKIGNLRPGISLNEKDPVLDIIVATGVDPNCEFIEIYDEVLEEFTYEVVCNPIRYELKKYRDPESIIAENKPAIKNVKTTDKGQDYFYDYLYNFESYIPKDAITKFDLKTRIDYDSYIFDTEGLLTDDYGFNLGSATDTDKFKSAVDIHWNRILENSSHFGVDPYAVLAMMTQESGGKNVNKYGIMQIYLGDREITVTNANGDRETVTITDAEKLDFDKNMRFGVAYYKYLLDEFGGNAYKAMQAYNFGPAALNKIRDEYPAEWSSDFGWLLRREWGRLKTYPGTKSASYVCMAFPEGVPINSPNGTAGDSCYLENVLRYYSGEDIERVETSGNSFWDKLVALGEAFKALLTPMKHQRENPIARIDFKNYVNNSRVKDILMTTKALEGEVLFSSTDNEDLDISLNFWENGFMDILNMVGLTLEELLEIAPPPDYRGYIAPIDIIGGGGRISSPFGPRGYVTAGASTNHGGVDIAIRTGTPIMAIADGKVVASSYDSKSGKYVKLDHGNGVHSLYLHMNEQSVKLGDTVNQGSMVGKVGNTGVSTGPHLHFEIRVNNTRIDPISVVLIGNQAI